MTQEKENFKPIEGKVADILNIDNKTTIVINKGYENGVKEEMKFMIYERGKEVHDPDSKKLLGYLEYVKAKVKITMVNQKLSMAESSETETQVISPFINTYFEGVIPSMLGSKTVVVPKELKVEKIEEKITKNNIIKKGDFVKQIPD